MPRSLKISLLFCIRTESELVKNIDRYRAPAMTETACTEKIFRAEICLQKEVAPARSICTYRSSTSFRIKSAYFFATGKQGVILENGVACGNSHHAVLFLRKFFKDRVCLFALRYPSHDKKTVCQFAVMIRTADNNVLYSFFSAS